MGWGKGKDNDSARCISLGVARSSTKPSTHCADEARPPQYWRVWRKDRPRDPAVSAEDDRAGGLTLYEEFIDSMTRTCSLAD